MDWEEFFSDQLVDPTDLTGLEDNIETAIGRVLIDHLVAAGGGVLYGLIPSQVVGPSPLVQVSPGIAYDGLNPPKRISVPGAVVVDLSRDLGGASTAVGTSGARWVTLTVRQARNEYDLRLAIDGTQIPFRSDESFVFEVFTGPVAPSAAQATLPSIPQTNVILADWLLSASATLAADVGRSFTRRVPSSPLALKLSVRDAVAQLGGLTQNNCLVVADSPWSMMLRVLPGRVNVVNQSFTIAGGLIGPLQLPTTNAKVVLVYVDPSDGTLNLIDGVESATPTAPSHTVGVALAEVLVQPGDTFLDESRIRDVRPFIGLANLRGDIEATSITVIVAGAAVAQLDGAQLVLSQQFIEMAELGASPAAPLVGRVRLYLRNNGLQAGQTPPVRKTQFVVRWFDGSDTIIAESPAT